MECVFFYEDLVIVNVLELVLVNLWIVIWNDGEFVVVNLENNDFLGGVNGEGLDWKSMDFKYGFFGDDVELGFRIEGKYVSNVFKDDVVEGEIVCWVCYFGLILGNSESIVFGCVCK